MLPPVIGLDYTPENENEEPDPRLMATMIITKLAGNGIVRVVGRCNEAQENNNLGKGCAFFDLDLKAFVRPFNLRY